MQCTEESVSQSQHAQGQALIIVNENFTEGGQPRPDKKRHGCTHDLRNMKALFKALDFKTAVFKDLSKKDMLEQIEKVCANKINEYGEYFVLVISSHAKEIWDRRYRHWEYPSYSREAVLWRQMVEGTDSESILVDDIVTILKKSDKLKGKPKLLFIQASRNRDEPQLGKSTLDAGETIHVVVGNQAGSQPSGEDVPNTDFIKLVNGLSKNDATHDINSILGPEEGEWDEESNAYEEMQCDDQTPPQAPELNLNATTGGSIISTPSEASGDSSENKGTRDTRRDTRRDAPKPDIAFDLTGVMNLPDDFLIVYPVSFGYVDFLDPNIGSRLLHTMAKEEHVKTLLAGGSILKYISMVAKDVASTDVRVTINNQTGETKQFKTSIIYQHRLCQKVCFRPIKDNSLMAKVKQFL